MQELDRWRIRGASCTSCALLAWLGAALAPAFAGDPPLLLEDRRVVSSDGKFLDQFGSALTLGESLFLVGAMYDEPPGGPITTGAVYAFARVGNAWVEEAELWAGDAASGMGFGQALALDGALALIGAWLDDATAIESGSAYLFERGAAGWSQRAKLVAFDGASADRFGQAVALHANTLVVGAQGDDDLGTDSGSVYVYSLAGTLWTLEAKLRATDGQAFDAFGSAVAIEGDSIVVGAPGSSAAAPLGGALYLFTREGPRWSQAQKLVAADPTTRARLGASVALSGETLIAGAPGQDVQDVGAAYVFRRAGKGFAHEAKLSLSSGGTGAFFGLRVAASAGTLAVAAPRFAAVGARSGSAFLYRRCAGAWALDGRRIGSDTQQNDEFAIAIALHSGMLACSSTAANSLIGATYLFEGASRVSELLCAGDGSGSACPCGNESPSASGAGCLNSSGRGATIVAGGSARVSRDGLRIHGCGLALGQPALLFCGNNAIQGGSGVAFGDGLRCVGGGVVRLGARTPGPDGSASYGPGLGGSGGWSAGDLRYFQVLYRDLTGSPCGARFNASSAVKLVFGT